jgi:hypothetical protein
VEDAPLGLDKISLKDVYFAPASHILESLGSHYASEAIMKAAWLVGSLGLIGSPTLLARNIGVAFHDLFALPYNVWDEEEDEDSMKLRFSVASSHTRTSHHSSFILLGSATEPASIHQRHRGRDVVVCATPC